MGKSKPPRHVAVALVHDRRTKRLLMVSSRAHPDKWICKLPISSGPSFVMTDALLELMAVPKGGIEEGESSGEAAVRESWEEGVSVWLCRRVLAQLNGSGYTRTIRSSARRRATLDARSGGRQEQTTEHLACARA